jgi:hypothetical protein
MELNHFLDRITVVVDDSIMRLLEEKENHGFFFW